MHEPQLVALREAAASGVDYDGLVVDYDDDGYRFETPEASHDGLSAAEFDDVANDHPRYVSNWHYWSHIRSDADRAFLRWVEGAEDRPLVERYEALETGVSRSWGEVLVTAERAGDGERRYHLRHEDDADVPLDDLEVHDDPLDARRLVKHDDKGRYRPLKTAPTLPHGWAFTDLDGRECTRAVDLVYPATITNWHLEREGELDVDHWAEAIERQTGIYGVVKTWNRGESHEHVNWVAEACCDDSQCLKRREWQYDDETDLDVDGGDGVFPCREPCSLVIAAARKWTRLEGEEPQTYSFELTPSEKEQLEDIVDAVADDRTDEIREADVNEGANRYRARFLRAKLMDDDGNLCGVPTDRATEE
ncbi:DR2241 family protein [Halorarius litoreus]|uniref:DR2241 family protein n=1 Tax=Halorarius litoreus TaxID=2962676 RepID=UPI0020CB95DF|nr:DR2241 family protein [Halorarius litoreus]